MTTYAPKFPQILNNDIIHDSRTKNKPLDIYDRLIAIRNLKVSIGAKLNYSK
jgi:hypothetical protein